MKPILLMLIIIVVAVIVGPCVCSSEEIKIVTPYLGLIHNRYQDEERSLELEDSSLMVGLFFQWVNPKRFQFNSFVYHSKDLNYSSLWGGHLIYDHYFGVSTAGKYVLGSGFDFILLDMDADDSISPLQDFNLTNNIYVTYLRFGRYFMFSPGSFHLSLLPWTGVELELVRGKLSFQASGPPVPTEEELDEEYVFALLGFNVRTVLMHFVELKAKYTGRFDDCTYLSDVSLLANVHLTRNWALSYRFKYMENPFGFNRYHLWGAAYVF